MVRGGTQRSAPLSWMFRLRFLCPSHMCHALLRGEEGGPAAQLNRIGSHIPGEPCLSDEESSSCQSPPGPPDTAHKVLFVLVVIFLFVPTVVLISE
jgi:hypothetical protein